jgi:hypothetical protein
VGEGEKVREIHRETEERRNREREKGNYVSFEREFSIFMSCLEYK